MVEIVLKGGTRASIWHGAPDNVTIRSTNLAKQTFDGRHCGLLIFPCCRTDDR